MPLVDLVVVLAVIMYFIKETPRRHIVEAVEPVEQLSVKEILQVLLSALRNSPALAMTIGGGVAFSFYPWRGEF